ncbi:hypothetical protein [Streptomyces spiramenti]|uniref:Uncharacterized protein n=1 Tax=Streptomyces spiramenti TaxID=2720606 RepID=A0ABX1AN49_9ACTN|nr:hypothetical protein [Streptomyces spiramenti]NJP65897.1 hypothetical protein [Streptomyces spiramenti]
MTPPRRGTWPTATRGPLGRLTAAAEGWRSAPATVRLLHRATLLELADELTPAPAGDPALRAWAAARDGLSARALARAADLTRVRALAKAVEDALRFARDGEASAAGHGLCRAVESAHGFGERPVAPDAGVTAAVGRAVDVLRSAATDFRGADLAAAVADDLRLAGVRWDGGTRWPGDDWALRVRNASAEDPPGSGSYVVLPEWQPEPSPPTPV